MRGNSCKKKGRAEPGKAKTPIRLQFRREGEKEEK